MIWVTDSLILGCPLVIEIRNRGWLRTATSTVVLQDVPTQRSVQVQYTFIPPTVDRISQQVTIRGIRLLSSSRVWGIGAVPNKRAQISHLNNRYRTVNVTDNCPNKKSNYCLRFVRLRAEPVLASISICGHHASLLDTLVCLNGILSPRVIVDIS